MHAGLDADVVVLFVVAIAAGFSLVVFVIVTPHTRHLFDYYILRSHIDLPYANNASY